MTFAQWKKLNDTFLPFTVNNENDFSCISINAMSSSIRTRKMDYYINSDCYACSHFYLTSLGVDEYKEFVKLSQYLNKFMLIQQKKERLENIFK